MTLSIDKKPKIALQPIHQCVPVTFHYDVHFTQGLFKTNNPLLAEIMAADGKPGIKRAIAVIDSGVLRHHPHLLKQLQGYTERYQDFFTLADHPMIVVGGEEAKNTPILIDAIHTLINEVGLCRHSYILAIGGGAVLDMVGYAAATAHRGIRLIRIPTTVLAQNDSAIGVKNGVNAFGKKNFLGTFAPPYAVLNDFDFLSTLDARDWRSGVAEAIKVALIKDADFFEFISSYAQAIAARNLEIMKQVIYRCAQLHLQHIANSGDPFEKGSSRPLDFGHWAAHRLEHLTDYRLRHGEAVAIGIALDCTYSYLAGLLSQPDWQDILRTLSAIGFTLYVPELNLTGYKSGLFQGLSEFQEHLGGDLTITLLQGIGKARDVHQVDITLYQQAVNLLENWQQTINNH
ncbi:3-dehydroquinate synthase [Gloeothece citriformis PCC 7424]|uniref:3-dehydroquinate synthase n=1 Tax=Gloeothece citriformis (strain PCC 7424) TaxID=65393 RepID=B7KHL4_GLOC7|nr:3-dehydroquinate synthase [Gloeothece citriformis]ACK70709.1 3-dehydroquinate synthase [Gloeothece citriformis PCC 7424]